MPSNQEKNQQVINQIKELLESEAAKAYLGAKVANIEAHNNRIRITLRRTSLAALSFCKSDEKDGAPGIYTTYDLRRDSHQNLTSNMANFFQIERDMKLKRDAELYALTFLKIGALGSGAVLMPIAYLLKCQPGHVTALLILICAPILLALALAVIVITLVLTPIFLLIDLCIKIARCCRKKATATAATTKESEFTNKKNSTISSLTRFFKPAPQNQPQEEPQGGAKKEAQEEPQGV